MIFKDDRTAEQMKTHNRLVVATDRFLSGWGKAEGGGSYAPWACTEGELEACERWVRNREDMLRVRVVDADSYKPSGAAHFHIYVWSDR